MNISYKSSGVDIDAGNKVVEIIKDKIKSTYTNGVMNDFGLFAGGFSLKNFKHMEEPILLSSTDGVGTKIIVSKKMNLYDTIGIDLVAMCVNDLICQGAKPLFFLDYIAIDKINQDKISNIVNGIVDGCQQSLCSLIGGETAEMPGLYSKNDYDLAGFSVGIVDKKNIINGKNISKDDVIIGLASSGLHSNGYSLARKIFFEHLNLDVNDVYKNMNDTIGKILLHPTKIYVKTILAIIEKFRINGIANITGGGLLENIPRILPENMDAIININSWPKKEIFNVITSLNICNTKELYTSLNMGIGMTIIVNKNIADDIIDYINNKTNDCAYKIGTITSGSKKCHLTLK